VDSTGTLQALGVGSATITARVGADVGTAVVRAVMRRADGGVVFDRSGMSDTFSEGCALTPAGRVYCTTRPVTGDTTLLYSPIPGSENIEFVQVGTGFGSACGLARDGALYCWWEVGDGLLGHRPVFNTPVPLPVRTDLRFKTMAVSGHTYVCVTNSADDVVYCWGHGHGAVLGRQSGIMQFPATDSIIMPVIGNVRAQSLAGTESNVCALDFSGTPNCWGSASTNWDNLDGVSDVLPPKRMAGGRVFTHIAVGRSHMCGLESDGRAYCAGANGNGQLGTGSTQLQRQPAPVVGGLRFRSLATADADATCGITIENDLYCWGAFRPLNVRDRTGHGGVLPVHIAPGVKFRALSIGAWGWCGVAVEGQIVCW
jgi:hypothetical protein